MPDDIDQVSSEETTQNPESTQVTEGTPPAAASPPAPETPAPQAAPPAKPAKKVITMPSDEVAKIRKSEREAGRKSAQEELLAQAKELGFASIEEMKDAAKRGKKNPPAKPGEKRIPVTRVVKQQQEHEQERQKLARKAALAERQRRQALREKDNVQVEYELKMAALQAGITDVDYAIHLLRKSYKGKTAKELESFDEGKFFVGLRDSHPHLFVAERVPATTGNAPGATPDNGNGAKPAPKPANPAKPAVEDKIVDARKMPREAYEKRLEQMGIKNPSVGYSY